MSDQTFLQGGMTSRWSRHAFATHLLEMGVDQIWTGIHSSKILVAELTGRNPNVFYELGLAHALQQPVVLVSSNEKDVPFDVQHIRVIYYNVLDPFWGEKLIAKIAENVLSALQNPGEAILRKPV